MEADEGSKSERLRTAESQGWASKNHGFGFGFFIPDGENIRAPSFTREPLLVRLNCFKNRVD